MTDNSPKNIKNLVDTLDNSLTESCILVDEVGNRLLNCANLLRVEQSKKTFEAISVEIENLTKLNDYIKEVRRALEYLKLQGYAISLDPLKCWDTLLDPFEEMLSAFTNKDWITLSDLIQYELYPVLMDGEKGLAEIKKLLEDT